MKQKRLSDSYDLYSGNIVLKTGVKSGIDLSHLNNINVPKQNCTVDKNGRQTCSSVRK